MGDRKRAFITGISGQDGLYLAKHLIEQGYHVVGATREVKREYLSRLRFLGILSQVELVEIDLTELPRLLDLFEKMKPREVYHLAAQSSVALSFDLPIHTLSFNLISTANL